MTSIYHPRPERWPQFSLLRVGVILVVLAMLLLVSWLAAALGFWEWIIKVLLAFVGVIGDRAIVPGK
jgi:hypothetical protein